MKLVAVDGWAVTFGTARRGLGRLPPPIPLLAVPNVTAHPSTASVPITVLLYNGLLLCGFNVGWLIAMDKIESSTEPHI